MVINLHTQKNCKKHSPNNYYKAYMLVKDDLIEIKPAYMLGKDVLSHLLQPHTHKHKQLAVFLNAEERTRNIASAGR
jgi:hypothetical protein